MTGFPFRLGLRFTVDRFSLFQKSRHAGRRSVRSCCRRICRTLLWASLENDERHDYFLRGGCSCPWLPTARPRPVDAHERSNFHRLVFSLVLMCPSFVSDGWRHLDRRL